MQSEEAYLLEIHGKKHTSGFHCAKSESGWFDKFSWLFGFGLTRAGTMNWCHTFTGAKCQAHLRMGGSTGKGTSWFLMFLPGHWDSQAWVSGGLTACNCPLASSAYRVRNLSCQPADDRGPLGAVISDHRLLVNISGQLPVRR